MLAIGRALMARPRLLMLDEPSVGLAPIFVERIFEIIREINEQGTTILLVEQNALLALGCGRSRLRPRDGPDRARRRRQESARQRGRKKDLPRRKLSTIPGGRLIEPCRPASARKDQACTV
jgi:ABC-type branched-subunit amino acid transport system ATPase component